MKIKVEEVKIYKLELSEDELDIIYSCMKNYDFYNDNDNIKFEMMDKIIEARVGRSGQE